MSAIPTIAGYALREALRRKVFAVVLLLTAGFLFLYWLANHYLFRDVGNLGSPSPADRAPDLRRRVHGRSGDVLDALPGRRARDLPDAGRCARRCRARAAAAAARPSGLATDAAVRALARRDRRHHAVRDRCLRDRRHDHRPRRRLVARPRRRAGDRARRRRRDRGGALAARLGLPHRDRERDRDLHALRRRPRLRPARLDRPRAQVGPARALGDDRRVGRAVRGALPGRAAPDHRRHDRLDGLPDPARAVRRRQHGRHAGADLGLRLPARRRSHCRVRVLRRF